MPQKKCKINNVRCTNLKHQEPKDFAFSFIHSPQAGFTLVEVLITVIVIAVVAVVSVPNLKKFSSDQSNETISQNLVQIIKLAQSRSSSSISCSNGSQTSGWSVEFQPTSYSLIGNCTSGGKDIRVNNLKYDKNSNTTMVANSCNEVYFKILFQNLNNSILLTCGSGSVPVAPYFMIYQAKNDSLNYYKVELSAGGFVTGSAILKSSVTIPASLTPTPAPTP